MMRYNRSNLVLNAYKVNRHGNYHVGTGKNEKLGRFLELGLFVGALVAAAYMVIEK